MDFVLDSPPQELEHPKSADCHHSRFKPIADARPMPLLVMTGYLGVRWSGYCLIAQRYLRNWGLHSKRDFNLASQILDMTLTSRRIDSWADRRLLAIEMIELCCSNHQACDNGFAIDYVQVAMENRQPSSLHIYTAVLDRYAGLMADG